MAGGITAGGLLGGAAEGAAGSEALAALSEGLLALLAPEVVIPVLVAVAVGAAIGFAASKVGSPDEKCPLKDKEGAGDTSAGNEKETEQKGGAHKETSKPVNDGMDSHHTPAKGAYEDDIPLDPDDGPAIKMDPKDHQDTASWGSSEEAREYRETQRQLIKNGKFKEAVEMDVKDIKTKFPGKYDEALKEMQDYVDKIDPELLKPK
jgi:hypothetical protein